MDEFFERMTNDESGKLKDIARQLFFLAGWEIHKHKMKKNKTWKINCPKFTKLKKIVAMHAGHVQINKYTFYHVSNTR